MPSTTPGTETLSYIRAVNEALRWALDEYPESLVSEKTWVSPEGRTAPAAISMRHSAIACSIRRSPNRRFWRRHRIGYLRHAPDRRDHVRRLLFVAFDQVINQASNVRYVSNGNQRCPVTIRSQQGATIGSCAQHSQCIEAIAHIPGIRVGLPAFPGDAFQMLRSGIACDDPVILKSGLTRERAPSSSTPRWKPSADPACSRRNRPHDGHAGPGRASLPERRRSAGPRGVSRRV